MKPSISIIVPVYNSCQSLPLLVDRISQVLPEIAGEFELILANDGSPDQSWEVIRSLADSHPWVRGINLMRNFGQHNALLCALREAAFEYVITMDDDLQNPPEEIQKLMNQLSEDVDVVYGTPQHESHGLWRDLASQVTKLALKSSMGVDTARNVSAFRAFKTYLRDAFSAYEGPNVSIDVLLTWATNRFTSVQVRQDPRKIGKSNYTFRKLVVHAMNMMTGFSVIPLQLASLVGFMFTLFGFVVLAYVLIRYLLQGGVVPGFAFLASIIALFSGAQLFALGIIGEYLARMHFRVMDKPSYAVRNKVNIKLHEN
jgi:undecaprenyl-phosphate 4-deoxy-4-formamido-L-arabinose transferase